MISIAQKPDLERTLERFEAWWSCRIVDRPPVNINVKSKPVELPYKQHASLRDRWLDMDYALDCFEARLKGQVFVADTVPVFYANVGPEVCGTLLGCPLEFGEDTTWSKPILSNCRQVLERPLDFHNEYWAAIRRGTDLSLQRGSGRWITGMPDLHTNLDLLAALRDPQELCMELVDDLEGVHLATQYVTDLFPAIFDDIHDRLAPAGQPCTSWTPSLHAGRGMVLQSDFIALISPAMFRQVALPALVREMEFLETSLYHLDGPGALKHLDDILAIPRLNAVQWIYGAGRGSAKDWIDIYRRIQAEGKGLQVNCQDIPEALLLTRRLRPQGVWFCIGRSYTLDQVKEFLNLMEKWAAGKTVA
jgi:hypothetical protein